MQSVKIVLSIAVFVAYFYGSATEKHTKCLENFFRCVVHGAPPEKLFNVTVECCDKLVTDPTYAFLQTFSGCLWETIEEKIAMKCYKSSGWRCEKIIPWELHRGAKDYKEFNKEAMEIAKPPSDAEGCGQFVMDLSNATHQLCMNNTKKDLQPMCKGLFELFTL